MNFDILGKPIPDATPEERTAALIALAEQWGLPCDILVRHTAARTALRLSEVNVQDIRMRDYDQSTRKRTRARPEAHTVTA